MTVADLIAALSALPQNLPVVVGLDGTLNIVEAVWVQPEICIAGAVGVVIIDGDGERPRVALSYGEGLR